MPEVNRVWRLRRRPVGDITDDVLSLEEESSSRTERRTVSIPAELLVARPDESDLDERC